MSKAILCLSIYSTIPTVIIIALSLVIAEGLSCNLITEVSGMDNKVKTSAKYDILLVDLSSNKDTRDQCYVWTSLGMEFFELLISRMLTIFLAYKVVRNICGKEGLLQKRREAKLQRDARKFEKLRIWFEKTREIHVDTEKGTENSKGLTTALNEGPATGLN